MIIIGLRKVSKVSKFNKALAREKIDNIKQVCVDAQILNQQDTTKTQRQKDEANRTYLEAAMNMINKVKEEAEL